jgi:hypothetical protein
MNSAAYTLRMPRPVSAVATVFSAGIVGAALDLMFAFVYYGMKGVSPQRILQTIGSGLLGTPSFNMGWTSAALGFFCHFFILIVAAWMFFSAAQRLTLLTRNPWLSGIAYGTAIYVVMNFIVVPLSFAPHFQRSLESIVGELCSHLFFVGLPIALIVRRYYRAP